MDLKNLTELMHSFVRKKGWYKSKSLRPQTPRNLAISLSIEASEVLEHFQWQEEIQNKEALADELADVALYLIQLASISDINLEQAIIMKLEQNSKRTWSG